MTSKTTTITHNTSWLGLLGVIFIVAKVFEIAPVADWSWWLVLLPFYLVLAIIFGLAACTACIGALIFSAVWAVEKYDERKRRIARQKKEVWDALKNK